MLHTQLLRLSAVTGALPAAELVDVVKRASMSSKIPVDTKRCVVHVDVDAFYAQCEEIRNPALKERPLGQCCVLLH